MSKGCLMIDGRNGRIKLGGPSWPNWNHSFNNFHYELRTTSSISVRAGRHPTDFLTHRLSSEGDTRWCLNRSGLHTFRWGEFLIFFIFSQRCLCSFLSSAIWRHVSNISNKSVITKCLQNIMYWRSVTFKTDGTFLYLFDCTECWCSINSTVLVCWYNCHYYSAVTVKDHDNSWPINSRSGTGWHSMIFFRMTCTEL